MYNVSHSTTVHMLLHYAGCHQSIFDNVNDVTLISSSSCM